MKKNDERLRENTRFCCRFHFRIELRRGATISGDARDDYGEPVVAATVRVGAAATKTDARGWLLLEHLKVWEAWNAGEDPAAVDEDQVRIFGDGDVQVIGRDSTKTFGYVVQHFLHAGEQCRIGLGRI